MRFACQQCQAKYSIPDERVQNRVIRLRCQKCGSEITIRGPAVPASAGVPEKAPEPAPPARAPMRSDPDDMRESTKIASLADIEQIRAAAQAAQAPPKPKPAKEKEWLGAVWHVIVKGSQVGPLSIEDIRAKVASQELTARSYAWREDMADWQRLQVIPQFASIFAPPPAAAPPGPPPRKKVEAQRIASLVDPTVIGTPSSTPWNEDEPAPAQRTSKEPQLSEVADLFGPPDDAGAKPLAAEPTLPAAALRPSVFPSEPGAGSVFGDAPSEPRESTRVFVAAAGFANRLKRQRLAALVAGAVVVALLTVIALDVSGVIEIPALGAAYKVFGVENPHAPDPQSQFTTNLTDAERARLRQGLMGGKKKEPIKNAPMGVTGNAGSSTKPDDGVVIGGSSAGTAPATSAAKPEGEQKMLNDLFQDDSKVEVKVAAPKLKTPEADAAQGLSAEQITHVVEGNQKAVKFCFERAMKKGQQLSGKMEVEFTIAQAGVVSAVSIKTAKYKDTDFGECTSQAIKSWKFPRFTGDPVAVEYPFILSAGL